MGKLPPIDIQRKSGSESFRDGTARLDFDLLSFWQWSVSDLVSNATRGVLAEYLVARALGLGQTDVREEWAAFDLCTDDGVRIEVKSAAFIQSWSQREYSKISFRVPKTRAWDRYGNIQSATPERQADVYVFAVLAHKDQSTLNPMDMGQWEFYVLPTVVLDRRERSQHSITLPSLQRLTAPVRYSSLKEAVGVAAKRQAEAG